MRRKSHVFMGDLLGEGEWQPRLNGQSRVNGQPRVNGS
jgi:hypothetical protein